MRIIIKLTLVISATLKNLLATLKGIVIPRSKVVASLKSGLMVG